MEKVIISEDKIQEFIAKSDKRNGAKLSKYKDLIERLISNEISLNAIYEFILVNDKEIGNRANFYKYVSRHITVPKTTKKPKEKEVIQKPSQTITEDKKTATTTPITSKTATQILSQDYDLLSNAE